MTKKKNITHLSARVTSSFYWNRNDVKKTGSRLIAGVLDKRMMTQAILF